MAEEKLSVADVIARSRPTSGEYRKISEFVGKVLSFVSFTTSPSKFQEGDVQAVIEAVDMESGEEVKIRTGAVSVIAVLQGLDAADMLPQELRVTTYKTNFPNDGYDLEEA